MTLLKKNLIYTSLYSILLVFYILPTSLQANSWFCDVKTLTNVLEANQEIKCSSCSSEIPFEYEKLPVVDNHYLHPYKGIFQKTFILNIPKGQVFGKDGWVMVDDSLIHELIWQNVLASKEAFEKAKKNTVVVKGRVAVIAQAGYTYYYHWVAEVLGRLALMELQGVAYDFLYVPTNKPYMKETLKLFGVDPAKIIEASDDSIVIADELIVPSLVASVRTDGCPRLVHYLPKNILLHIRNKMLAAVEKEPQNQTLSKKVFLSRKDAAERRMLNEDDVFALFEEKGFKRYLLTEMSLVDQILLFKNADIIVGALGSNLTNVLFCDNKTRIFDVFQARRDCTIYYLCQNLGLPYTCVKTTDFIDANDGQFDTTVPLDIMRNLTNSL